MAAVFDVQDPIPEGSTDDAVKECMKEPDVTLVIVPRERFSVTERALKNVYEHTTYPFKLVYVSGGTTNRFKSYLENESRRKHFQFIHTDRYLSPNQARNLAMRHVKSKYVVFLENDVLVTPGWLEALVGCAEETGAWLVGPLYLIGEPELQTIHMAGGTLNMLEHEGKRILHDEHRFVDTPISELTAPLERGACDYVEFHCMLVRTEVFERLGPLDEELLSIHEHIDLAIAVARNGGSVYVEPKAVTTYIPPPPSEWYDLPFIMIRWGDAWNLASVGHFRKKWNVSGLRFFNDTADLGLEDTIIRWARAHRRLSTGLHFSSKAVADQPLAPLEEAELLIAIFSSVDRDTFDFVLTDEDGHEGESATAVSLPALIERLPQLVEVDNLNVAIQPIAREVANTPALIRLDDLDADEVDEILPYAFLTLEVAPQNYQCWLAIAKVKGQSTAALGRILGITESMNTANGAVRLAGSRNVSQEVRQADGSYPRVKLVEARPGLLNTVKHLENDGVTRSLAHGHIS